MAAQDPSRKHAKRTPRAPSPGEPTKPRVPEARKSSSPKAFADYEAALVTLRERLNVEQARPTQIDAQKVFNLDRMSALMDALDNPQKGNFKTVHVGGSKGKGSTCEMTAAALESCGYTVGLFTSPHLVDLSERIRIDQRPISPEDFTALLSKALAASDGLSKKLGEVTYFELLTAVAFLHFYDQAVDIAVIEVGMGGRLDATNVLAPEVTALSAIQLEHTHLLGNTLEKIAKEKSGIFKSGVPAVSVSQKPEVLAILREAAAAAGTTIEFLNEEIEFSYRFEASPELGPHARVCLSTPRSNFEHLPVPLKGEHQAQNCGLALAILDRLRDRGVNTPEGPVATGLSRTPSNGRLELIHKQPRIMIDGAHNPESIAALVKAIGAQVRYDSMVVVFGCAADKDVAGMLSNIALGADKIIFTKAEGNARAMDPRDLTRKFNEVSGKMAQNYPSLKDALNKAAQAVSRDDLILVTGSFALAGEAKRLLNEKAEAKRAAAEPAPRDEKAETKRVIETDHARLREVKVTSPPVVEKFSALREVTVPKAHAAEGKSKPRDDK